MNFDNMIGRLTQEQTEELFVQAMAQVPDERVIDLLLTNLERDTLEELAAAIESTREQGEQQGEGT